jgi:hypothetical protein
LKRSAISWWQAASLVGEVDGDEPGALVVGDGRVEGEAGLLGAVDEDVREGEVVGADAREADRVEVLVGGPGGVVGGHRRGAGEEVAVVAGVADRRGLERERGVVAHPAGEAGPEALAQGGLHPHEGGAGAAAQPLVAAADGDVDVPVEHVDRDAAGGLVDVDHDERADLVGAPQIALTSCRAPET